MIAGTLITPALMTSSGAPNGVKLPTVFSISVSTCFPVTASRIPDTVLAAAPNTPTRADARHHAHKKAGNSPIWLKRQGNGSAQQGPC